MCSAMAACSANAPKRSDWMSGSPKTSPEDALATFADALPVVATGKIATARPGQPDDSSADAAIASIRRAVDDVVAGRAGAVVTNPIAKSVLYRAGFRHPGHTEFLAELAAAGGHAPQPVMMLWSPALAVVPVTIHLSLRDAIAQLSTDLIVSTARIVAAGLQVPFRDRPAASRLVRAQSPCRGRRFARHRGAEHRRPRPSTSCAPRASTSGGRCRPTPCSTRPRAKPMTARSACITTRR